MPLYRIINYNNGNIKIISYIGNAEIDVIRVYTFRFNCSVTKNF